MTLAPQKFYRLLIAMREDQRAHDTAIKTNASQTVLKSLRLARAASEKKVDAEWPSQIVVKPVATTAALVRDLRLVQDEYWRTGDELAQKKARELARELDARLESLVA